MYVHATKSNTFGHLFTGGPQIIQIGAAQIHKIYILNLARYLFLKIHTAQIAQTTTGYTAQTMLKLFRNSNKVQKIGTH